MQYGRVNANMVKLLAPVFVLQVGRCFPSPLLSLLNKAREKYKVEEHQPPIFRGLMWKVMEIAVLKSSENQAMPLQAYI